MVNKIFTDVVRLHLLKHDFYKTGKTFRMTKVFAITNTNTLVLLIDSTHYFKFLWDDMSYDILNDTKFNDELSSILVKRIDIDNIVNDRKQPIEFYTSIIIRTQSEILYSTGL